MFGTRSFPPVDTQTHINWGTRVSGWRLLRWINSRLSETSSMSAASSAGLTDRTGVGITGGRNYTVSLSRTGKTFIPVDGRSLGSTGTEFKPQPESPPETSGARLQRHCRRPISCFGWHLVPVHSWNLFQKLGVFWHLSSLRHSQNTRDRSLVERRVEI